MVAWFAQYLCLLIACLCVFGGISVSPVAAHDNEPVGSYGDVIPVTALGKSAIGLEIQTVRKTSLPMEISVPGKIEAIPMKQFEQHATVAGRITKVTVALGQAVKAGQILAYVDSPEINQLAAQLLQSKVDTESEYAKQKAGLEEEVKQAEGRLQMSDANLKRLQKLYEDRIVAQKDVFGATNEHELAKTRLNTAIRNRTIVLTALKSKIDLMQKPLRQRLQMLGVSDPNIDAMLRDQITMTSVPVRAARAGIITDMDATPGMGIEPSLRLFIISDLSSIWATAQVYEDDMSRMKLGERVLVKVHALAGERVEGVLTSIGSHVDPQTRTLPVRAALLNASARLKPDMYAELIIQTRESSPIIVLPRDAVVDHGGHQLVFVETPRGFQPTYVEVGRSVGDDLEIVAGIKSGERVVVRGAFQLGAQLLKSQGATSMFSQPTEGEHSEIETKAAGNLSLNTQTLLMLVAAAFILGFGMSAVFLVRSGGRPAKDKPRSSELSETVPDELPVIIAKDASKGTAASGTDLASGASKGTAASGTDLASGASKGTAASGTDL
jgi:membrane fusion protein, heavy metal efflux system